MAQRLKRLPGMQETGVRSLGWEDPLEKEMAAHSSTLAWKFPWREEPGRLQSMGSQRVGHEWATSLSLENCKLFMWHFIPHVIVLVVDSSITLLPQAFKLAGISFLLPVPSLDVGMSQTQSRPELGRKDGRRSSNYRYLCPRKETDGDQNSFFFSL